MFKKIAIVADHNGEGTKQLVCDTLAGLGVESVFPQYTDSPDNDYPDVVRIAYDMYMDGEVDGLIMLCGTGVGMCIAANKCRGLRCVLANEPQTAAFGRIHEDCNALAVGVGYKLPSVGLKVGVSNRTLKAIVKAFVTTNFEGGRHLRRVNKLDELQNRIVEQKQKPKSKI